MLNSGVPPALQFSCFDCSFSFFPYSSPDLQGREINMKGGRNRKGTLVRDIATRYQRLDYGKIRLLIQR